MGRHSKRLAGSGESFGISFRPGTFHALLDAPVGRITGRVLPLRDVLGREAAAWAKEMLLARDLEERMKIAETFLSPRLPPLRREAVRVRDVVERLMHDQSILRAEDVAGALEVDLRTLQRLFRKHVGVSPKWVIRRYRLHEAAEQLKEPNPPALAALAASLGYADQAHFARDFKIAIGRTPRAFRSDWSGAGQSTFD